METLHKIFLLLTPQEQKRAGLLFLMILIMAILDMIGVASILPFITVLVNPDIIETNFILKKMFEKSKLFGVNDNHEFFLLLGIIVFLTLITSLSFKALTTFCQVKFVQNRQYTIGRRLMEKYLKQPYTWFLNRHSADLGKTILSEVGVVVASGISQLIELIAKSMIVIAIIFLLIFTDPKLALIISVTLGGSYLIIFLLFRVFLNRIGKERLKNNKVRFLAIDEAFGAAKEVKVGGLEEICISKFSEAAKKYAITSSYAQIIRQIPRYFLEIIAFGGILLVLIYLMVLKGSFSSALPIISLYVFAGYRLLPALQQVYSSLTQLAFVGSSLDKLYKDLNNLKIIDQDENKSKLFFSNAIKLRNVDFNYPNSSQIAVKNINLIVPAKTTVGFIGKTGSGKTTTVDILLGLLKPQKGTLEIDEQIITNQNVRSWQNLIGYVPQHIYLVDDTIAANIAFGVETKNINKNSLEKAAKIANLHNFVIGELPDQYHTKIGESGVKLSGGQRQRVGIARALYNNPQILVLDEATSALDNETEQHVMDAIKNLRKDMTIILIAHRLNTVKSCDIIFKFEKGKLIKQGKFNEVINS